MKKKTYNKPTTASLAVVPTPMMAASPNGPSAGGNASGTGPGGDDNDGKGGQAKQHTFNVWEEEL